ncbi:MAG: FkbM family methyltransferase [Sulfuritalea sp.]|nr:FkbM family methyltransferase [Sulfuritalea sp.]
MAFKLKKFLKAFARSRNVRFAMEFAGAPSDRSTESFYWKGMPFFYRPKTSDAFVAYECFLHGKRNAYYSPFLPVSGSVKTIIDVGANVGGSVLYWKSIYPEAKIHCFEPIPSNYRILKLNCDALSDVIAHNEALGDENGEITFIHSPSSNNEGGWSVFQRGATGNEEKVVIPIKRSSDRLNELGITQIDILKVDTEGAERMIIRGLGEELLARTNYICGELHGERDFELLDYLEHNGFRIGVRKSPKSVLFNFEAIRS